MRARWTAGAIFLGLGFGSGCGPRVLMPLVRECRLPSDQSGTLIGKKATLPIGIRVAPGIFSEEELTAIAHAADVWNVFFEWSMGQKAIEYGTDRIPDFEGTMPDPSTLCTGPDPGVTVISGVSTWTLTGSGTLAVAISCPTSASPYDLLSPSVIIANFQDFFRNGNPISNFQNVMLHEMGHVLGLHHSCESGGGTGMPDCESSGINPTYLHAIMYPSDKETGQPEASFPNENDQERMNCLYKGT